MNKTFQDLTGQKFGKLTVLEFSHRKNNRTYWLCQCKCGSIKTYRADYLKSKSCNGCGCVRSEVHKELCRKLGYSRKTHGMSNSRIYKIYVNMKDRCYRVNNRAYKDYGGRGIKICDEWFNNPSNFIEWAINNGYGDNLSIDRIDNNGDYCPENCRWVTSYEQNINKRSNIKITYNGKTQTLKEWANELGFTYSKLHHRYSRGWDIDRMMIT